MSEAKFSAKRRAWEDNALNDHLRDFDVSDARDRAIEARTAELLERRGEGGYHPFGDLIFRLFADSRTIEDILGTMLPNFASGDYAAAGLAIAGQMCAFAEKEAAAEAAIQVDREWNEASGAALDAYDDRED